MRWSSSATDIGSRSCRASKTTGSWVRRGRFSSESMLRSVDPVAADVNKADDEKGGLMRDLADVMMAIDPAEPGAPEVLVPVERPVPRPGAGEVLIRVAAAGVNRPDVLQRKGAYPPPPGAPSIPGLEIAGEIVAVGEGVDEIGRASCR